MDIPQMIDIEEATRSLVFYAELLDLQCAQYSLAVNLDSHKKSEETGSLATNLKDEAINRLRVSHKDSLVLSILLCRAIVREGEQLDWVPQSLLKVMEVSNRMIVASRKAGTLIEEHDRKESEKNVPLAESPTVIALREFLEKHRPENRRPKEPG